MSAARRSIVTGTTTRQSEVRLFGVVGFVPLKESKDEIQHVHAGLFNGRPGCASNLAAYRIELFLVAEDELRMARMRLQQTGLAKFHSICVSRLQWPALRILLAGFNVPRPNTSDGELKICITILLAVSK
jgi:hypothetical protein